MTTQAPAEDDALVRALADMLREAYGGGTTFTKRCTITLDEPKGQGK